MSKTLRKTTPIRYRGKGEWYFWEIGWEAERGPFRSEKEAVDALMAYCKERGIIYDPYLDVDEDTLILGS